MFVTGAMSFRILAGHRLLENLRLLHVGLASWSSSSVLPSLTFFWGTLAESPRLSSARAL
jgi:hypothetical protein